MVLIQQAVNAQDILVARVREIPNNVVVAAAEEQGRSFRVAALSKQDPVALRSVQPQPTPAFVGETGPSTPLHVAARSGASSTVRALIRNGAVTNAVDEEGRAPLHVAADAGRRGVAQVLLLFGADIDQVIIGQPVYA